MKRKKTMSRGELVEASKDAGREMSLAGLASRKNAFRQHDPNCRCVELQLQNHDLHKALREAAASRDGCLQAYDHAPVACVTLNARGIITNINLAGARMLGSERAALLGLPFSPFVARCAEKDFANHIRLCRRTRQLTTSEFPLAEKVPDSPRHVQFISAPVPEAGSRVMGFQSVMLDITEHRIIETQADEVQSRFRQFAESIREVFWMADLKTRRMIYLSPGYQRLWGRTSFYQSPQEWLARIVPEDRERVWAAAQTKQSTGEYDLVYRLRRSDGSVRWIHDRAFPVRDESGEVHRIAGIADDITERKLIEKELIEISDREQCRFGQDLHDGLCQHLAGIEYLTQSLKASLADKGHAEADQAAQIAMLIGQASAHAHDLARGLSPVPLEAGGLMSALQELAATTERLFQVGCKLRSDDQVLIHDNVVATHLYRIAQEAVSNAIKHGKARRIVINLAQDREWTVLSIKNDGAELPEMQPGSVGLGGRIMNFRAGMIGGVIELRHAPDRQPMVVCSVHNTFSPPAAKRKPPTMQMP